MFSVRKNLSILLGISVVAVSLAACGDAAGTPAPTVTPIVVVASVTEPAAAPTDPAAAPTEVVIEANTDAILPEVDPATVTGNIIGAGSSTVFPLAEALALQFKDEGYAGSVQIDSIGSGAGFERFCKTGETDLATASRAIKDEEVTNCTALGRTPIEFRVGTDALAVVVSTENTFVDSLTIEQLATIFSGTAKTWQEVNPEWPADAITLFSPGTDSGTFDYFVEKVFDKDKEPILNAKALQLSEDDNVLVQGVAGSAGAIGYFGYAYYLENTDKVRTVTIEGIEPNETTAEDGTYPLARPLFVYSDATIMKDKPQVAAFINYFLTNVDDVIVDIGYFPASEDSLNQARQNWLSAQ